MDAPEAPNRQAVMLARLIAAGLIIIGLLDTGLYVAHCFRVKKPETELPSQNPAPVVQFEQSAPVRMLPIVLNAIPFVAGVVMLARAKSIATWISDKLE